MMDHLILHEATRRQLESFVTSPSHALLLTAPAGMGKTAIAEALAARLLGKELTQLGAHPYYLVIKPEGPSISIDAIRQLQKFLQLKTVGNEPLRRIVLLEYAHLLTTEAQNAFLKLLEEPPADTVMILTADSPQTLLPTILSRTQGIAVNAPAETQLQAMLDRSNKDELTRRQAYFLSGGLPGLLSALLAGDDTHPLLTSVGQAKEILQKTPFERLALVDGLCKQKEAAMGVVESLERIARSGLTGAGSKHDTVRIRQWHRIRKAALEARDALRRSANAKLVLSHLFTSF
jgi:replication-associated recombination protein RarA